MLTSIGISIFSFPYILTEFYGTLLFHEYPTTVIFEDRNGNPIVREWVDYSDELKTDRYFYYYTDRISLKQYITGELPHIELIRKGVNGFVIFEDVKIDVKNYSIVPTHEIPSLYLPEEDFYFDEIEGVDLGKIVSQFHLDKIDINIESLNKAKEISNQKSSETLLVHFKKGKGIGFGTANTEVLARTLLKFDKFYKETALDVRLGPDRGEIQLFAKKNEHYLQYTETEVYGNIAASYAILLRPSTRLKQIDLFATGLEHEEISKQIFSLINTSIELNTLKEDYHNYSDYALKSYKALIDEIYNSELNINFNWFSPSSDSEFSEELNYIIANKIKYNLNNLSSKDELTINTSGKFRSLNCDTGHYTFIALTAEKFTGFIDKSIKEGSEQINFLDVYGITILREITKVAGNEESSIKDNLVGFYINT
jgi:hypothetical protein